MKVRPIYNIISHYHVSFLLKPILYLLRILLIFSAELLDNGGPDVEQQPEEDDSKSESKRKITPNGHENGIKGAIKEKTSEDIEKERKKQLMMLGCEAFLFTIRKRNRLQDPKNPRHRWFRWKDR